MLYIVLPAYNEEAALKNLLADIAISCKNIDTQIIIVNDASTDQTLSIAEAYVRTHQNVRVLTHENNMGLGAALMTGFKYVLENRKNFKDDDIILTMDADNTHPAKHIPQMVDRIHSGADLVVASRYAPGGVQYGLNRRRRILSWGAGHVMGIFFPITGLKDYSCGYRAYRASVLDKAYRYYGEQLIENRSFAAMVELLIKVVAYCKTVCEVPLSLHYERKIGCSKMKICATILGYVSLIIKLKKQTWGSMEWAGE